MKMEPDHENGAIFKLQPNENIILIGMPYSKKAVFNFEKVLNPQNHSSSGSLDPSSTPLSSSQISD